MNYFSRFFHLITYEYNPTGSESHASKFFRPFPSLSSTFIILDVPKQRAIKRKRSILAHPTFMSLTTARTCSALSQTTFSKCPTTHPERRIYRQIQGEDTRILHTSVTTRVSFFTPSLHNGFSHFFFTSIFITLIFFESFNKIRFYLKKCNQRPNEHDWLLVITFTAYKKINENKYYVSHLLFFSLE